MGWRGLEVAASGPRSRAGSALNGPSRGELDRRIARRIGERSGGRAQVGLALVLTTGVFAAMAGFGGVGYAVDSVTSAVNPANANMPSNDQYGTGGCVEYVNPHGTTIPPAGLTPPGTNPKGGENPDGFYQVGTSGGGDVYVIDLGSGIQFGPFSGGTVIKYTQATGATPSEQSIGSTNGQAGAVSWHIAGTGDFAIVPVGGGPEQVCLVPRPPK